MFADIGVSGAIIHYQKVSNKQLSTLYWLSFIFGLSIFIILNLLSPLIAMFYTEPELSSFINIIAFVFLIIPIGQQFETLLIKELVFKSIAQIEVITSTIMPLVSIIMAYYGWGVISVV